MADLQLTLSQAERDCLTELLQAALKQTRVEEHRTRTPSFREHVVQNETLIEELLKKLGHPAK
jgi:hypothetical protein